MENIYKKFNYSSKKINNVGFKYLTNTIKIDNDVLYILDLKQIRRFNLYDLHNFTTLKIYTEAFLPLENDILFAQKKSKYKNDWLCKYNNGDIIKITELTNDDISEILLNDNKIYLFSGYEIIVLHENYQKEKYKINGYNSYHNISAEFNSDGLLYLVMNTKLMQIFDLNNIYRSPDKLHMIHNDEITIDYYDNILLYNWNKSVSVYCPDKLHLCDYNTRCYKNSNIVQYNKSLYYINPKKYLAKEDYA